MTQKDKIRQLKSEGWNWYRDVSVKINRRSYLAVVLEKNGEMVAVNHQGGTDGIVSEIAVRAPRKRK